MLSEERVTAPACGRRSGSLEGTLEKGGRREIVLGVKTGWWRMESRGGKLKEVSCIQM